MNDTNRRYHDAHAPHAPAFLSRSEQRRLDLQPGAVEAVDAIKRERDEGRATIARLTAENARMRSALRHIAFGKIPSECEVEDPSGYLTAFARRALADADTGEGRGEGWIACSERMPELGGEYVVAVTTKDGRRWTEFAAFDAKGWWVDGGYDVTHWRPLPAPPRSEKKATP